MSIQLLAQSQIFRSLDCVFFCLGLHEEKKGHMEVTKKMPSPGEIVLALSGRLDFTVRKTFQSAIKEAQTEETRQIVLDLTNVSFVDCSALGIFIRAYQTLAQQQIALSIMASPGRVLDTLQTTHLDKMIPVNSIQHTT